MASRILSSRSTPFWGMAFIGLHFFFLFHLKFTAWPEMLGYPYLINKGYQFYGEIIHLFMPILPYFLASIFRFTGETVVSLKTVTWAIIIVSDFLLWYAAGRVFGSRLAVVALGIFIWWQIFFEGNGLWFDLACVPLFLCTYIFLLQWFDHKTGFAAFSSGIFLAMAFLTKLSSLVLIFLMIFYLLITDSKRLRKFWLYFLLGLGIPLVATVSYYASMGKLSAFFYWAVVYPLIIVAKMPGYLSFPTLRNMAMLIFVFSPAWFPFLMGLSGRRKNRDVQLAFVFFGGTAFFSLHRFALFHFQPVLPFLAIMTTWVVISLKPNIVMQLLAGLYIVGSVVLGAKTIGGEWGRPVRFVELEVITKVYLLQGRIAPETKVFLYNLPVQYAVFAKLHPMKPWADTFPWYLELPHLQEKIVEELKNQQIRYVFYSPFQNKGKYDLGSYRPLTIDQYVKTNFMLKEKISDDLWILEKN